MALKEEAARREQDEAVSALAGRVAAAEETLSDVQQQVAAAAAQATLENTPRVCMMFSHCANGLAVRLHFGIRMAQPCLHTVHAAAVARASARSCT
jgi:hypothetical protein